MENKKFSIQKYKTSVDKNVIKCFESLFSLWFEKKTTKLHRKKCYSFSILSDIELKRIKNFFNYRKMYKGFQKKTFNEPSSIFRSFYHSRFGNNTTNFSGVYVPICISQSVHQWGWRVFKDEISELGNHKIETNQSKQKDVHFLLVRTYTRSKGNHS